MKTEHYKKLEAHAKRLEDDAVYFEDGTLWVGPTIGGTEEQGQAVASSMLETAKRMRAMIPASYYE